jgi:hypothetical protein
VSVGAVPPAQVIQENQVTVREPVASCLMFIEKAGILVVFESASVRLLAIVTWCLLFIDKSKVTVAPSVAVDGRVENGIVFHSTAITHDDTRVIVVSLSCHIFTPENCGLSLVQSPMSAGIAVTFSSSISPEPAVLLPRIRFVFTFCIFAKVTESSMMSAVILGVASL